MLANDIVLKIEISLYHTSQLHRKESKGKGKKKMEMRRSLCQKWTLPPGERKEGVFFLLHKNATKAFLSSYILLPGIDLELCRLAELEGGCVVCACVALLPI